MGVWHHTREKAKAQHWAESHRPTTKPRPKPKPKQEKQEGRVSARFSHTFDLNRVLTFTCDWEVHAAGCSMHLRARCPRVFYFDVALIGLSFFIIYADLRSQTQRATHIWAV